MVNTTFHSNPSTVNFFAPYNWQLSILKTPNVDFFIQRTKIPSIVAPPVKTANPFVDTFYPGDHLTFDDLTVTFKVSEDFSNYFEIYNWLIGLGFPDNYNEYDAIESINPITQQGIYSDLRIIIQDSHKTPQQAVYFTDAFPIYLGEIEFFTDENDIEYASCSIVFRYTKFGFEKVV